MTDVRSERVTCDVCEAESEQRVSLEATEDGPPDLDTRPPETLRSTMPTWVQRCPACGYCAPDLGSSPPRAARVVKTAAYQALLVDARRPPLASAFLAASAVFEAGASFGDAAWQSVYAAWACDDAGDLDAASDCRDRAVNLFASALLVRQQVVDEPGGADALIADLLRRAGRFEESIARVEQGLAAATMPTTLRALRYIAALATRGDRARRSLSEAPPVPMAS